MSTRPGPNKRPSERFSSKPQRDLAVARSFESVRAVKNSSDIKPVELGPAFDFVMQPFTVRPALSNTPAFYLRGIFR